MKIKKVQKVRKIKEMFIVEQIKGEASSFSKHESLSHFMLKKKRFRRF